MTKKKYWAYKHVYGSIILKTYRGESTDAAINDAYSSEFVTEVMDPFEASGREEAEEMARKELGRLREVKA